MKIKLLVLAFVVCMITTPAMASLFDFHFGSVQSQYTYASGAFDVSVNPLATSGSVTRFGPIQTASFLPNSWSSPVVEDFSISMIIGNIDNVAKTADGTGSFTLTDTGGDVIAGSLAGSWTRTTVANNFVGTLSNVTWADNGAADGNFDGHIGSSASMSFAAAPPWVGGITELSTTGIWFGDGSNYTSLSGSVDASVVPVPAAVLLGVLGLGVASLKLRKYA